MPEYFIVANSGAAPFVSDTSHHYAKGRSPGEAFGRFKRKYKHPCGLYAAVVYPNADAYHKEEKPLLNWLSEKAKKQEEPLHGGGPPPDQRGAHRPPPL